jgi:hypothetical protein
MSASVVDGVYGITLLRDTIAMLLKYRWRWPVKLGLSSEESRVKFLGVSVMVLFHLRKRNLFVIHDIGTYIYF